MSTADPSGYDGSTPFSTAATPPTWLQKLWQTYYANSRAAVYLRRGRPGIHCATPSAIWSGAPKSGYHLGLRPPGRASALRQGFTASFVENNRSKSLPSGERGWAGGRIGGLDWRNLVSAEPSGGRSTPSISDQKRRTDFLAARKFKTSFVQNGNLAAAGRFSLHLGQRFNTQGMTAPGGPFSPRADDGPTTILALGRVVDAILEQASTGMTRPIFNRRGRCAERAPDQRWTSAPLRVRVPWLRAAVPPEGAGLRWDHTLLFDVPGMPYAVPMEV